MRSYWAKMGSVALSTAPRKSKLGSREAILLKSYGVCDLEGAKSVVSALLPLLDHPGSMSFFRAIGIGRVNPSFLEHWKIVYSESRATGGVASCSIGAI